MSVREDQLVDRNYVLIIDKSGSMGSREQSYGGKTRWDQMKESTLAIANKIETLDADGIDVYVFSSYHKKYSNVTAQKVDEIFRENEPCGSTALHKVLDAALTEYFTDKSKPVTILVVTDGEPDDKKALAQVIVNATKRMTSDEEIAISFIQIGTDLASGKYLKQLDDDLVSVGAKFDIVDTVTFDEMENKTITEVLLAAVND